MKYHACAHQSRKWFVSSIDKAGFRDYYLHSVCDMHNYDQLLIVLNALTLLMSRPLNLLTMVAFRPIYCVIFGAMSGDIVEAKSFYSRFLSLTANPYLNIFMLSGEFSTELLYEDLNSLWLRKATMLECSLHWWLAYVHTHSVERFFFKMLLLCKEDWKLHIWFLFSTGTCGCDTLLGSQVFSSVCLHACPNPTDGTHSGTRILLPPVRMYN